jgi:hypothetical protein
MAMGEVLTRFTATPWRVKAWPGGWWGRHVPRLCRAVGAEPGPRLSGCGGAFPVEGEQASEDGVLVDGRWIGIIPP